MAVKVTNSVPRNGDVNVAVNGGKMTVNFQFDEQAQLTSATIETLNVNTPCDEQNLVGQYVPAGQNTALHFTAQKNTHYCLTIEGQNANGVGSSCINIQTAAGGVGKGKPPRPATAQ